MKSCYSHYGHPRNASCAQCPIADYCRSAQDPALLRDNMPAYNEELESFTESELTSQLEARRQRKRNGEIIQYSRNDLLEVISFMLNLDGLTKNLLSEKIAHPDIALAEIARKRNTSRQAVHQAIQRKIKETPELARLLCNREYKSRQHKQPTFMEAVCKIKRQQSTANSNAPAINSNSYRSLISWNQNFDLSKTNILKGSSIFPNASTL